MKKLPSISQLRVEFRDYYFDTKSADRVVRFFERELTHQIGELAGTNFKLEKWQKRILRHFFGWRHRITHLRKYRILYLEIPRKNGKSILAAGLGIYLTDADNEPAARVVCFAKDEEQAMEAIFDVAGNMIKTNPKLSKRMTPFKKTIAAYSSASNFKLLTGNSRGKHGKNLSALIGDEVHEWEDKNTMDALRTSMAARSQPVEIYLTTAGCDWNSIWGEFRQHVQNVEDGTISDPSFLGVVYAAESGDDWKDPKTWAKANPNIGVSVKLDYLKAECDRATKMPSYENTFKRLHLNLPTEQDTRWMSSDAWEACYREYEEKDFYNKKCFVGIDLGSVSDISAIIFLFQNENCKTRYSILPYFFIPAETVPRRTKEDKVKYQYWVDKGFINTTPGNVCDYAYIEKFLEQKSEVFEIESISLDRWQALYLATNLSRNFEVIFFSQTLASMAAPMRLLEELIIDKTIEHNNHPVMNWMVNNVAIMQDASGNTKPDKNKSKEKIDGVTALVNGLGRAIVVSESEPSIYEERGFLSL